MSGSVRRLYRPKHGRSPQDVNKVPFQEVWKLQLKNQLSRRNNKNQEFNCLTETLAFLTCLKDNNNLQAACTVQAEVVQRCYEANLKEKAELKKQKASMKDFIPDKRVTDMTKAELNRFLSHFPHKLPPK